MTTPTTPQPTYRRLSRGDDRWVGGVCSGVADYLGVDVTLVRLLTVVGTILGFGCLALVYLVAWVLVPSRQLGWPQG
ncbi:MAG: PspC domain-containing protein [Nocardioides sp.]|nr:PspC domain-containing protein [Nocardioides sp.]